MGRERVGVWVCLLSAAAFSSSTVFGRLALDDGVSVPSLLALRYGAAAPLFWLLVVAARQAIPGSRAILQTVATGAFVVAPQAYLIYSALERLSAGLVIILLYTFPAIVAIGSVLTGREQPSRRKAGAVLVAIVGTALVMLGDGQLQADGLGVAFALASAVACALWVLISDRVVQGTPALTVSALMSTGAALTLSGGALALGAVEVGFGPIGWAAVVGTVIFSTVVAISTSLAGVARVGPTVASVLLTVEIPLAVTWSIVLLGESLRETQIVGGALIVAAVLLLQVRTIRWPSWVAARYAPQAGSSRR